MTRATFNHSSVGRGTLKGRALQELKDAVAAGANEVCTLRLAANVVDEETITLGSDVFKIHVVNTDTTVNVSGGDLNNTAAFVREFTIASHGQVKGSVLRVENEYLLVTDVLDSDTVSVQRGYAGSTIATHADTTDIYKAANALGVGDIPIPVAGTLTPTAVSPLIAKAVTALSNIGVTAISIGNNEVLFHRGCLDTVTYCSETLTGTNNTIDTSFHGGLAPASALKAVVSRVPTATEVTLGNLHAVFPFTVTHAVVRVHTTATGVVEAWDGAVTVSGQRVTVDNSGTTDWAATSTVTIEAYSTTAPAPSTPS